MKRLGFTRAAGLAAVLALAIPAFGCGGSDTSTNTAANADGDVTADVFTDALAGYGAWVDVAPYGKVWQPNPDIVGQDFMPYATDGHWALNDDGDWVFASKHDDEFGWAVYHYGRWAFNDDYGWVWVPGTEWAPAWVEWRYGGGYTAWAPMAPEGVTFGPERWVVVEEGHFVDDNLITVRLAPERVTTVWTTVTPITEVHAGAHFHVGPASSHWGAKIVKVSVRRPAAGAVRAHVKAIVAKTGGTKVAPKTRSVGAKASVSVNVAAGVTAAANAVVKVDAHADAKPEAKGAAAAAKAAVKKPAPPPEKKKAAPKKK